MTLVLTMKQAAILASLLDVDDDVIKENFIVTSGMPIGLNIPPPVDCKYVSIPKEDSWQKMNRGKLSKKQRRQ